MLAKDYYLNLCPEIVKKKKRKEKKRKKHIFHSKYFLNHINE